MNTQARLVQPKVIQVTVGALLASLAAGAAAQSNERLVVPLSDPGRPATLDVSLFNGSVAVTGYDGEEIVIVTRDGRENEPERPGTEGLRRIPNTALGLTAEERTNTVSIALDWSKRGADLEISVPRRTSVRARSVNGDVAVRGVEGDHELSNVNSDIVAVDLVGSAVISTQNGDVQVSLTQVTAGKAMSFSSFNGDIEVTLPANLTADLRINAGRGDVLTDFDFELKPQQSVVENSGSGVGRYRVRLEREVRVAIGGGGPEIRFNTFNGDIVIRRSR